MKSLKRGALVELVVEQLTAQLAAGTWPIGSALPGEVHLAEELGVGRSTLREAIRALVHGGLLETRQGSGTFVRRQAALSPWDASILTARIVEVHEVREALEVQAAKLAARRRSETDIRIIDEALAARDALSPDQKNAPEEFVAADLAFHRAIVVAAGNDLLLRTFDSFSEVMRSTLVEMVTTRDIEDPRLGENHFALARAIAASDPVAAAKATETHMHVTIDLVSD